MRRLLVEVVDEERGRWLEDASHMCDAVEALEGQCLKFPRDVRRFAVLLVNVVVVADDRDMGSPSRRL